MNLEQNKPNIWNLIKLSGVLCCNCLHCVTSIYCPADKEAAAMTKPNNEAP